MRHFSCTRNGFLIAFDSICHTSLLHKLRNAQIPQYLIDIIDSFLSERYFQIRINNILSEPRPIQRGVPQGAALSPLLFNLYCHDITTSPNIEILQFADDTFLITQSNNLTCAINKLQHGINNTNQWLKTWKLELNPNKTVAKIFTLRRLCNPPRKINIEGTEIEWHENAVKYLGVLLDKRLTFSNHVAQKLATTYNKLKALFPLINRKSQLKLQTSILIYKTILRPTLTYAAPIWYGTAKTNKKKLQTFQNKFCRIATNAPWFCRNSQIQKELKLEPINDFLKNLTEQYLSKLQDNTLTSFYNIGQNRTTRLKPRLPQNFF